MTCFDQGNGNRRDNVTTEQKLSKSLQDSTVVLVSEPQHGMFSAGVNAEATRGRAADSPQRTCHVGTQKSLSPSVRGLEIITAGQLSECRDTVSALK